jgi:hypothetical protein
MKKKSKKMLDESKSILSGIIGEAEASTIIGNMFPPKIKGYTKGKILTVGELKKLPKGSILHIWYIDEDRHLREDDFLIFDGFEDDDFEPTANGFSMPIDNLTDDDLLDHIDNCGWTFTVSEAILT